MSYSTRELQINNHSSYSQIESDRRERHHSMNRALPVHQSSCSADIFPQCHRVPTVNMYYVEMSPIGSLGTSVAQVLDCERSFLIIFPLHQPAVEWRGFAYIPISAYTRVYLTLYAVNIHIYITRVYSVSLHNCTSGACTEWLVLIFSTRRIYHSSAFASYPIFQMCVW